MLVALLIEESKHVANSKQYFCILAFGKNYKIVTKSVTTSEGDVVTDKTLGLCWRPSLRIFVSKHTTSMLNLKPFLGCGQQ